MKYTHLKPWFMAMACVLITSSGVFGQRAYLVVDRATGNAEALASTGIAVDGYSIGSPSGLLNTAGWNSLQAQGAEGWTEANPSANLISEFTLTNGNLDSTGVPIGAPYMSGMTTLPSEEDVTFQLFTPPAGGQPGTIIDGTVIYQGDLPTPKITVNRASGAVSLTNPGGFEVDGFSIGSASGLLDADSQATIPGFANSNSGSTLVTGLNWDGAASFPATLNVGNVFSPGGVVALADEDLTFEYTRPTSTEVFTGIVEYTGAVNDLVLKVDEISGMATIEHMSPNVGALDITGYSVLSDSDGLSVGAWSKIGGDFTEAGPRAGAIAEVALSGSMEFSNGTSHSLGSIFTGSNKDLVFEYSTPTVDRAFGSVHYVFGSTGPSCTEIAASRAVPGDLDGVGGVQFADFLTLSQNFGQPGGYEQGDIDCSGDVTFADFLTLSQNFGQTGAASSVPEPASMTLGMLAALMGLSLRKRR